MIIPAANSRQQFKLQNIAGLTLILISSILLGIWAVKGTIALRNILLVVGTPLSLFYCYQYYKFNQQKIPFKNFIPIILTGLMFCWVIFHYLFLSRFPEIQLHELKSTWLRTLLATIVGFGTGLALLRRPNAVNFLWLGILISFFYLFYQYVSLVISTNNIHYKGYEQFIYLGKINGVLVGTILIAGLLGTLLDRYPSLNIKTKIIMFLYWLTGTCAALYAYGYIFDARNGIGLAVLIFGLVTLILLLRMTFSLVDKPDFKIILKNGLFILVLVGVVGWFGAQQFKLNLGWSSMIEDGKIAVQIEKYPNWQNPRVLGYPVNELGALVQANTYERISWATAGTVIFLPENPLGVGILSKPFGALLNAKYPNSGNYIVSTHSAWVEVSLAFGIPAIFFVLGALISILIRSVISKGPFKYLPAILSIVIILLYTVGELSNQHSIEVLFFLIALLGACLLPSASKRLENQ
jgi:hypothetical protein